MREARHIYIVDDDLEVRTSLTYFLSTVGFFARPSAGGVSFLAAVDHLRPGCVLLDMHMPDLDGIEVIKALGDRINQFPVVGVSGHGDVSTAVRAMKMGASDFLEKPFTEDKLLETVERVFETLETRLTARNERAAACARIDALTRRERDVLICLAGGSSNKIIAYQLNLSVRTVEMHRASMMDNLGVKTLPDALRLAFVGGVIAADAKP